VIIINVCLPVVALAEPPAVGMRAQDGVPRRVGAGQEEARHSMIQAQNYQACEVPGQQGGQG
jgi:hypothetical protein